MEWEQYINIKKDFQKQFLEYIDSDDDNDHDFYSLIKNIENQISNCKKEEIRVITHFIQHVSENHQRNKTFFTKMMKLLTYFKDQFKQAFSNNRLFKLFINNKLMLLILFKLEIIIIDECIFNILMNSDIYFKSFFYPEIKAFICKEQQTEILNSIKIEELVKLKDLEKEMLEIDPNIFENFDEKRQNGENDNYICDLIRNDSIEDFIIYHSRHDFSLSSTIKQSIFETNSILTKQDNSIIEYAAFFGSIQIFQYLQFNNVELKPSLWFYVIHSQNAELIHLLEENIGILSDNNVHNYFIESIKCHHDQIAKYLIDIIQSPDQPEYSSLIEKIFENSLCYYNFEFMQILNYDIKTIQNLFKYDYEELVRICLNNNDAFDIKGSFITLFNLAMEQNNIEIIFSLLYEHQGIEKDTIKFSNDLKLIEIEIPSFIKEIKQSSFERYKSLQKVIIPESVEKICDCSFKECKSLNEIIILGSVKIIGNSVFEECSSLKTLIIPDSVSSIGNNCFKNCTLMTEITIPESVEIIGISAFEGCTSLTKAIMPKSIIRIFHRCFKGCKSLKEITIPESVEIIGSSAFDRCTSLTEIIIPNSVVIIGIASFYMCLSLNNVIVPASVRVIGKNAFSNCKSLESMAIPYYARFDKTSFLRSKLTKIGIYSTTSNLFDFEPFQIDGITFEKIPPPIEIKNNNDNLNDIDDEFITYFNNNDDTDDEYTAYLYDFDGIDNVLIENLNDNL